MVIPGRLCTKPEVTGILPKAVFSAMESMAFVVWREWGDVRESKVDDKYLTLFVKNNL
jgi:hypothetical protein